MRKDTEKELEELREELTAQMEAPPSLLDATVEIRVWCERCQACGQVSGDNGLCFACKGKGRIKKQISLNLLAELVRQAQAAGQETENAPPAGN